MSTPPLFILASASPARRQLLIQAGITPVVHPSRFDESSIQTENPADLVEQLALGKASAVAEELSRDSNVLWAENPDLSLALKDAALVIMGCDSLLVVNSMVCGKPKSPEIAVARWKQMRGRQGTLLTGHVLIDLAQKKTLRRHQGTQVTFADISDRQIEAYVATGEPLQCAGAFALDGRGGLFVQEITGCYSNIIGLSLPLLREMLEELGYCATDFWIDIAAG